MSTIKNLVKTFKERQATEGVGQPIIETPMQIETPIIVEETQSIKEPKPKKEKKPLMEKKVPKKVTADAPATALIAETGLSDAFFASLNEQNFSYEKSKFAYIDKKHYEILMTLKRKKDVKNISSLINAALSQFIEQNKEDIKRIFMDDLL